MIFLTAKRVPNTYLRLFGLGEREQNQTRGMYGLRRTGENTKTVEIKAAATGANIALIEGLFKLCGFIFYLLLVFFNFCAKVALFFIYASKKIR